MRASNRIFTLFIAIVLAISFPFVTQAGASGTIIYDSIPDPLPPNLPSLGYQATQTAEFGDHVAFAGTDRELSSVTVTMSNWALHSTYPDMDTAGFVHPITLNIYNVDNSSGSPALGTLLTSLTQDFLIPWRPEADPTCATPTAWRASDGQCYNGYAFNIVFDFSAQNITLPNEIIYGLAYNTNTWGAEPIGLNGPYESLNFALSPANNIGTDVNPDGVYWNTQTAAWYADGGTGGVGIFRPDTNWAGYVPAVRFEVEAVVLPELTVSVIDSLGNPIEGATITYAVGSPNAGWQTFGTTGSDGKISRTDLTPGTTYHFYATHNASYSLQQALPFDGDDEVTFQTTLVKAKVETCPGAAIAGASVTYGSVNGGFLSFGTTDSEGIASKELFPGYERTFYAGINATSSALQTVTVASQEAPLVTFKTTKVTIDYAGTVVHGSANGGWYPFTKPSMEMFAGVRTFRLGSLPPTTVTVGDCQFEAGSLTVNFPGIASVHTYVKKSDGAAGTANGQQVAEQTYKNNQALFASLPNGVYDLVVVKGSKNLVVDDVVLLGNTTVDNLVATMTVKFPGINTVHTYVKMNDGVAGTAAGGGVDESTYKNNETTLTVLKGVYDVIVVKGSKQNVVDAVDCNSGSCLVEDLVATMTVRFPGINSVHTYVKVDNGVAGTATGGGVDESTYKNNETTLTVLKGVYDIIVVKGSKQNVVDAVDCNSGVCLVDNLVATMTVKFPGINTVHTYVKVDDGAVGAAAGGGVDESTYKNNETSLIVLKGVYDVIVVKGSKQNVVDAVDCNSGVCLVENLVATMTVKFPGINSVHTYVKVDNGVAGTAAGGGVDESTYKNNETTLIVLKGVYDVIVVKGSKQNVVDAVDCNSGVCLVENLVSTFTLNFPGKTSVHTYIKTVDGAPNAAGGGAVDERTYQNNSTSMALLKGRYDVVVRIGAETFILDDIDCTGLTCTYSLTVVKLLNSSGGGISGGVAEYYMSGWKPLGTTPASGVLSFAMPGAPAAYSFRMSYAGYTQQKSNINITTTNPIIFQTLAVTAQLMNSANAPLSGGGIEYYASGWKTFGSGLTDGTGSASMELLPGSYSFRMSWAGYTQQQSNVNISTTNPVIFQTQPMTVHFKNSLDVPLSGGGIDYYASGWRTFGSGLTDEAGDASMELLAGSYSFRMSWAGYTQQQSNINITTTNPLDFQTMNVYARLEEKTLPNDGIPGGVAQYYASGWKPMGATDDNGNTPGIELLPGVYSFKMTHAGATEQKSNINITTTNPVIFQTVNAVMSVKLEDSLGNPLSGGVVRYYASGWKDFGVTDVNGIAIGPNLLPGKYSFQMTYGGYTQQKSNIDISLDENKPLVYKTVNMLVTFKDSYENPIEGGVIRYYASGWKNFGATDVNGEARFELLPGIYSFQMTYGGYTQQQSNINLATTNPLEFQTVEMKVNFKNSSNDPIEGGVVRYYASGWKDFGTTDVNGSTKLQLLPGVYSFQMTWAGYTQQKSNINIATTNPLDFQTQNMEVKLTTCNGTGLEGGAVKYYASGWKTFGATDANGGTSLELLPGTYSFQTTWAGQTEQRSNINITTTNPLIYKTTKVTLQYPGTIQYYASGWKAFTSPMELLPYNYPFKFGATQTKLNVGGCEMTKSAILLNFKDHAGKGLAGGTARGGYGSNYSAWFVPGSTDANGNLFVFQDGLLKTMSYEMGFNSTTQVKTQDVSVNPVFQFNTNLLTLRMETCGGVPLNGGSPRGGSGSAYTTWWFPGGSTGSSNPGESAAEFFPGTYSFEMQYKATADAKVNVIVPDADTLLTWRTTNVTLDSPGEISYGGATGDSTWFTKPFMELLPGTYKFNFRPADRIDLTLSGCSFNYTHP